MAHLRPVSEDDRPRRKPQQKSVAEAAQKGTPRELLVAMRDRIATAVANENTPARDLAALTRRLLEVVRDIEQLDARERADQERAAGEASDGDFDPSAV